MNNDTMGMHPMYVIGWEQGKLQAQQELEAYARQKQLELLDEIKEELQHISTYLDTQDEDGFYFETIDLDDALNILTKKREQITLENKHEK